MENVVKTEDIVFEYQVQSSESENINTETPPNVALDGVSIAIDKGEFVAVLGHNGSGKSTLAKHINGLLQPKQGVVWVKGISTAEEEKTWEIRQSVGMVFQNPDNQIIATIVEEDVAFGPENLGVPPTEIRQRVDEALEAVGMTKFAGHPPHQLSGGQKQRIAIAGILAMRPDIIVMDESTAMLDPIGRREVMAVAHRLNAEGITIILITHYMDEAAQAGRIVVMNGGKVVMEGKPFEIFTQIEKLQEIGLDVPQAVQIAHKLRENGINLPKEIVTGKQLTEALLHVYRS